MRKTHVLEISRQGISKFTVAQRTVSLISDSSPRSHMHFVNSHWSIQRIPLMPVLHPGVILPRVFKVPDDRRRFRRNFVKEGKGIGLIDLIVAASCSDMKFIERAFTDTREKPLPNSGVPDRRQGVCSLLPIVKRTDDRNFSRIGRPYGKIGSTDAIML